MRVPVLVPAVVVILNLRYDGMLILNGWGRSMARERIPAR